MDRVLEIGGFAAGYCGRLFAQSGYDVVRVESQPSSPGWVSQTASDFYLHAGKRRLITSDPGLIAKLAAEADVVIAEAATADALAALGFSAWQTPVKVSITPFGTTGPKRNWQATSSVILAMGGYTNLMGDPDRAPLTLPGHYPEFQSGAFAYTAANACRIAKQKDTIDIGMLEVVMALSQFTTVMWHCAKTIRSRHGNDFWTVVPTNLFRCVDGWAYLNIVPTFWDAFAVFLKRPELLIDQRFKSNDLRSQNRDALQTIIAVTIVQMTRSEIEQRATECRVPIGVVQTLSEVLDDPHLSQREFWQSVTNGHSSVQSPRTAWKIHGDSLTKLELNDPESAHG